jgi:hypothetical protein
MATTTTNYGFDIPQSTDLVKDGATAIATLGQDIDTAMNTALGTKKAGMVLLNTTSFSAVSSQSINDVFTSDYTNYLILLNVDSASTGIDISMRLRVAGADNSSSNYGYSGYVTYAFTNSQAHVAGNLQTSFDVARALASGAGCEITLFNPQASQETKYLARATRWGTGTPNNSEYQHTGGLMSVTTSYTGYTLICSTGNFTGSVSTYGINK